MAEYIKRDVVMKEIMAQNGWTDMTVLWQWRFLCLPPLPMLRRWFMDGGYRSIRQNAVAVIVILSHLSHCILMETRTFAPTAGQRWTVMMRIEEEG